MTIEGIIWYLTSETNTRDIKVITTEETKQLLDYITTLQEENKKLKSIIKEAREYIDRRDLDFGSEEHNHVLEILDKENKQ